MDLNEIKKSLYKEKPTAYRFAITGSEPTSYLYDAILKDGRQIFFKVPVSDMGDKLFTEKLPAQLLIRWIEK